MIKTAVTVVATASVVLWARDQTARTSKLRQENEEMQHLINYLAANISANADLPVSKTDQKYLKKFM